LRELGASPTIVEMYMKSFSLWLYNNIGLHGVYIDWFAHLALNSGGILHPTAAFSLSCYIISCADNQILINTCKGDRDTISDLHLTVQFPLRYFLLLVFCKTTGKNNIVSNFWRII
jgi:hypothetical protein